MEHETEIFIRAIFDEPISGAIYRATMLLLLLDRQKAEKVLAQYPPTCALSDGSTFLTQEDCEDKLCSIGNKSNNYLGGFIFFQLHWRDCATVSSILSRMFAKVFWRIRVLIVDRKRTTG